MKVEAMTTRPPQRPEGKLIAEALARSGLSARKAAAQAGMSDGRWHQIVKGYQTMGKGIYAPVEGPAETVARMAQVVGITPDQLAGVGRDDAARELRALPAAPGDEPEPSVAELAARVAELTEKVDKLLGRNGEDQGKAG